MNERHRQQQFKSPLECPELELDPEKKLWVPGKKKFFLPAPRQTSCQVLFSWDIETVPALQPISLSIPKLSEIFRIEAEYARDFYARMAECVPGRDGFIVPTREVPVTRYRDIQRSSEPMFRNHLRRNW